MKKKQDVDVKVIQSRKEFLQKLVDRYKEPVLRERIKPAKLIEEQRWDYLRFSAEREQEIQAARGLISQAFDNLVTTKELSIFPIRKKNSPPVIDDICRKIIPVGGKVNIYGNHFVDGVTEVYIQYISCHCVEPLDSDYVGDGGCWSMHPGESVGWADRVVGETILIFTLPDDYLTYDEEFTTATEHVRNFSRLAFMVIVPGEGDSNVYPSDIIGLKTVPASAFNDPPDVHTTSLANLEDLLLNMINEIRGWNDVGPVTMDPDLRAVARTHAQLMNDQWGFNEWVGRTCTGWLDCSLDPHEAPGEADPADRVEDAGFTFGGEIVDFRWSNSTTPMKNTAEFWDNSCGHRAIMIDASQRFVGIGVSRSEKTDRAGRTHHYYTYTCDFAR